MENRPFETYTTRKVSEGLIIGAGIISAIFSPGSKSGGEEPVLTYLAEKAKRRARGVVADRVRKAGVWCRRMDRERALRRARLASA